jgi:hypothetical protein
MLAQLVIAMSLAVAAVDASLAQSDWQRLEAFLSEAIAQGSLRKIEPYQFAPTANISTQAKPAVGMCFPDSRLVPYSSQRQP